MLPEEIKIPIQIDLTIRLNVIPVNGALSNTPPETPTPMTVPNNEKPKSPKSEPKKKKRMGRPPGWKPGESYADAWDRYEGEQKEEKLPTPEQTSASKKTLPYTPFGLCHGCGESFDQYQPVNIVDDERYHIRCAPKK